MPGPCQGRDRCGCTAPTQPPPPAVRLPPPRFYGGSVAHLLLFNAALEPRHVAGLYAAYRSNNGTDSGGLGQQGPQRGLGGAGCGCAA